MIMNSVDDKLVNNETLLWVGIVFIIVIRGRIMGLFSPAEAGTTGTIGVLVLVAARKELGFKMLVKSFDESLMTAATVILLIYGSKRIPFVWPSLSPSRLAG